MEIKGVIKRIGQKVSISEKFEKLDFVIEELENKYPQDIKIQLVNDKISLIDRFKVGDKVEISFNIKGKEFEKNGEMLLFNNIEAWKIDPSF